MLKIISKFYFSITDNHPNTFFSLCFGVSVANATSFIYNLVWFFVSADP